MARLRKGQKPLLITHPDLSEEWDYKKNGQLTPETVSYGSTTQAYWICPYGHSYQMSINKRASRGDGCQFCSGKKVLIGFNDLATTHPSLALEWDFVKNAPLTPKNITRGSGKRVYWKCSKGHSWIEIVNNRTNHGYGCPYCSGKKTLEGYNDFKTWCVTNNKICLLDEWDYEYNEIDPSQISPKNNKKVWWKCSLGHRWDASIGSRTGTLSSGCPYCSNPPKRVLIGFNDFETWCRRNKKEYLLNEWNYDKNAKVSPKEITYGCGKKVWWKCNNGHEWFISPSNRASGTDCPYCSGRKVLVGFNDLATTNPELCEEWDYEKNNDLLPRDVIAGSHKKVWWICSKGHKWPAVIYNRAIQGTGCPYCTKKGTSLAEQGIAFYLSQVTEVQQRFKIDGNEIDIYLPLYGVGIEYDGMFYHANRKEHDKKKELALNERGIILYRIIEDTKELQANRCFNYIFDNLGANYEKALKNLCESLAKDTQNGMFTSININAKRDRLKIRERFDLLEKENNLAAKCPELAKEWNYEKNGILIPEMFSLASNEKIWWKCSKGHEWPAIISNRSVHKMGCPYCSGRMAICGTNDLFTTNPDLAKEWDYDKNAPLTPYEVSAGSEKKVWWIGKCGHEWQQRICDRIKGCGCLYCSGKKILVGFNDLATTNPELCKDWDYEKNNPLTPQNVSCGSNKKVYWLCQRCGYSWIASISNRSLGRGCKMCGAVSKSVINLDTGVIYKSISEAAKACGIKSIGKISDVCNGKQQTAGGYHWEFVEGG